MGPFWPFLGIFSEPSHFLALMEPLKTKKWSRIQNYIQLSFKRSKNEVKRTFLAPSKNYHASTSAKINQVLEVRLSDIISFVIVLTLKIGVGYTGKKNKFLRGIFFLLPNVATTPKIPKFSSRSEIKKFSIRFVVKYGLNINLID